MTKEEFINKRIPVADLKKVGFFKPEDGVNEMEAKICKFFGLKNIFEYEFIGWDKRKPVKADIKTFSLN